MNEREIHDNYVRMTLESGIPPLEMKFSQINHAWRRLPIAYRSNTYINSIKLGVLTQELYTFVSDNEPQGVRVAEWNVREAIRVAAKLSNGGRKKVEFITARCPINLMHQVDLYEWMKNILEDSQCTSPEKICLEFPQELLLDEDAELIKKSILDMRLLKVKTMMSGCANGNCPVTKLMDMPVDFVILSPEVTARCDDRDKGKAATAFIGFLRSADIQVIGEGVVRDDQMSILSRADCFGYIPSEEYSGNVQHGDLRMSFDDALAQKEEEVE